jgi:hypothetical protein
MADTNTDTAREKGPLHRPSGNIDAGKPINDDETTIVKPPSNADVTLPGIDAPIPAGQTTKM